MTLNISTLPSISFTRTHASMLKHTLMQTYSHADSLFFLPQGNFLFLPLSHSFTLTLFNLALNLYIFLSLQSHTFPLSLSLLFASTHFNFSTSASLHLRSVSINPHKPREKFSLCLLSLKKMFFSLTLWAE